MTNEFEQQEQQHDPYAIQAEAPVETAPAEEKKGLSNDEMASLLVQSQRDMQQQNALMYQQLMQSQQSNQQQSNQQQGLPDKVGVQFDKDGNPYIDSKDILGLSKGVVDQYHKDVISPVAPTIEDAERSGKVARTAAWLQQNAPEMMQGKDPTHVANLAVGLYQSDLNPGRNDAERTHYVMNQLQNIQTKSGNPDIRKSNVANQVGRTEAGAQSQLPYPKGSKITIGRSTPAEMGLDRFMESVAKENDLRELSTRGNLGYTFEVKRPD